MVSDFELPPILLSNLLLCRKALVNHVLPSTQGLSSRFLLIWRLTPLRDLSTSADFSFSYNEDLWFFLALLIFLEKSSAPLFFLWFFFRTCFHLYWVLNGILLLYIAAADELLSRLLFESLGFSAELSTFRFDLVVKGVSTIEKKFAIWALVQWSVCQLDLLISAIHRSSYIFRTPFLRLVLLFFCFHIAVFIVLRTFFMPLRALSSNFCIYG